MNCSVPLQGVVPAIMETNTWQTVTKKRKIIESISDIPTQNRFSALENDKETVITKDNNDTNMCLDSDMTVTIPPIFLPNVVNVGNMMRGITQCGVGAEEYTYKSMIGGELKLMAKSIDSYRELIKIFRSQKVEFHSYQVKQDRAYRVVVKGIHQSTPIDDIKCAIEKYDHKVRSITVVRSRVTKQFMNMFFVDLEPAPNNKDVYNIIHIDNAIVQIVAPIKRFDSPQCTRCQKWDHTKAYCNRAFVCVKCGQNHPTAECTKPRTEEAKCGNCNGIHTANFKGCPTYQRRTANRSIRMNNASNEQNKFTPDDFPILSDKRTGRQNTTPHTPHQQFRPQNTNNESSSYAKITAGNNYDVLFSKIEDMMARQFQMITNMLTQMMSSLIEKLCNK